MTKVVSGFQLACRSARAPCQNRLGAAPSAVTLRARRGSPRIGSRAACQRMITSSRRRRRGEARRRGGLSRPAYQRSASSTRTRTYTSGTSFVSRFFRRATLACSALLAVWLAPRLSWLLLRTLDNWTNFRVRDHRVFAELHLSYPSKNEEHTTPTRPARLLLRSFVEHRCSPVSSLGSVRAGPC